MRKWMFPVWLGIACLSCGCVLPGQNTYINDPFTGGVDSSASKLLNIPLPTGLQYYPSHSKISGGARKEGLEVWRGYVEPEGAAASMYSALKDAGWQIRMMEKASGRAVYIYQRSGELAAIVFQKQGVLTVIQIWSGPRLEDGTSLSIGEPDSNDTDGVNSLPGEEYGPAAGPAPSDKPAGKIETWGGEARDL